LLFSFIFPNFLFINLKSSFHFINLQLDELDELYELDELVTL